MRILRLLRILRLREATMTRLAASVPPGEVSSEVAERALRRIKDYLAHPADRPDEIILRVEAGHEDQVLVLPRAAVHYSVMPWNSFFRAASVPAWGKITPPSTTRV